MKETMFQDKFQIIIPGSLKSCIKYATKRWILASQKACDHHGFFSVALSGGSTPLQIYQELTSAKYQDEIPWEKVFLFWSDERSVPFDHRDSNYRMAMEDGGFNHVPIPKENIFRMHAENEIEKNALLYEETIKKTLKGRAFDLIMLGMGNDGHTASLFPHTEALHTKGRLVVANEVPRIKTHRMTMTYDCLQHSTEIHVYIFGSSKASTLQAIFQSHYQPDEFPIQRLGTFDKHPLFILDDEASQSILSYL